MKKFFLVLLSSFLMFSLIACDGSTSENTLSFETLSTGAIRVEDGSCYSPLEDGTLSFIFLGEATEIVVPAEFNGKTVTEIHGSAFFYSKKTLRSVTLPNTIRKIGDEAFKECELLSEINLPDSITFIGHEAFAYCSSLKHITIPACLIQTSAFAHSGLETVTISEGVEKIPASAFFGTNLKEVVLPSSIREIEMSAFQKCESLEKAVLNNGLQHISTYAFGGTSLKEIVIPASVTDITEFSFMRCKALEHVYFEGNAPEDYLIDDNAEGLSYTIHYHEGAAGFTSPEWCGFSTELW